MRTAPILAGLAMIATLTMPNVAAANGLSIEEHEETITLHWEAIDTDNLTVYWTDGFDRGSLNLDSDGSSVTLDRPGNATAYVIVGEDAGEYTILGPATAGQPPCHPTRWVYIEADNPPFVFVDWQCVPL